MRVISSAWKMDDMAMAPSADMFEIGSKVDDPLAMYLNDVCTIPINLAGLPGMSIPCGFDERGLPVGLQLMGSHFSEARLLGAAHRYQQATDWHLRVPKETPL